MTLFRTVIALVFVALVGTVVLYAQEARIFLQSVEVHRGRLFLGKDVTLGFEGATNDDFELTVTVADPTADVAVTLPVGGSAAYAFMVSSLTTNDVDVVNSVWGASNALVFEGATANAFELTLSPADVAADVTVTIPDMAAASALLASTLTTNAANVVNSVWGASNALVFEGATADAFELTLSPADVAADVTVTIPDMAAASVLLASTLTTNTVDAANSVWGVSNGLVFEGATANTFELTLSPADVTADETVTIPNFAVNFALVGSTLTTNTVDAANSVWFTSNSMVWEGATADGFEITVTWADPAADFTMTFTGAGQSAGEQLQTDGAGVLTWEAAASSREMKNLEGLLSPTEALKAILSAPVHLFHYKQDAAMSTGDKVTQYAGIVADEAPWAMHFDGKILNPINTFGYTVGAIQALEAEIQALQTEVAAVRASR